MTYTRRVTRQSFKPNDEPATSAYEQTRARQTGKTVREIKDELARFDAADRLEQLLITDKENEQNQREGVPLLSREQRHALHIAVGVLRKEQPRK